MRGVNLRRRLPLLAAVVMLVLAVGCTNNTAGKRIAFVSDRDGDYEIFVMDADGSHVQQLTDNNKNDWDPVWSPDGKRIAFDSNRYGDYEIFVMDADGSHVVAIGQKGTAPSWR